MEPLDDESASSSDTEANLSALERLQPACTQLLASHGDRARQRGALRGTEGSRPLACTRMHILSASLYQLWFCNQLPISHLAELHSIMEELGPSEVGACSDSALFPLLLTLDRELVAAGSVDDAGPVDAGTELATAVAAQPPRTMHASNAVVEAALRCLQLVLASLEPHSTLKGTPSLVAAMLPRLAAVLTWPEASEEALQLTIACLGQLLLERTPGGGEDAIAVLDGSRAADKDSGELDSKQTGAEEAAPGPVPHIAAAWATAFFRAPDGPTHFGHLCSTLLQVWTLGGVWMLLMRAFLCEYSEDAGVVFNRVAWDRMTWPFITSHLKNKRNTYHSGPLTCNKQQLPLI